MVRVRTILTVAGELKLIRFLIKERIADKEFAEKRTVKLEEIVEGTGIGRTTLYRMINSYGYVARTDAIDRLCAYFKVPAGKIIEYVADDQSENSDQSEAD